MISEPARQMMLNVLIVEDDALIGMDLEWMVTDLGYFVLGPYRNLYEGVEHAAHDEISFALLDFDLGQGMNAMPIAEILSDRHIGFAFTTGTASADIRNLLPHATIIGKPVSETTLQRVLP